MGDPLFQVRNSFYLGAYNLVVQEASELEDLPDAAAIERDCYLYRAYIALGSHQVGLSASCVHLCASSSAHTTHTHATEHTEQRSRA